jgi:hypothetical protein
MLTKTLLAILDGSTHANGVMPWGKPGPIRLADDPGDCDSPPILRLRLLLKRALRVFRLRCVRLEFGTPTPALAERGHT